MTLDGLAAVHARIAQIQAFIDAAGPVARGAGAANATASPASSAASGASPEFASLLADAMASSSLGTDPTGSSGSTDSTGGSMLAQLSQLAQLAAPGSLGSSAALGPAGSGTTVPAASAVAQDFLTQALAQQGKAYVYGADPPASNANPAAFDCEGLVRWAAARVGISMPMGATAQYLYLRDHGTTMSVQQALHTPGALLFHFSHEPKNLGDIPADGHVAISVGDGVHTIEARGHAYGTNVFANAAGRSFDFAGMIPGMT